MTAVFLLIAIGVVCAYADDEIQEEIETFEILISQLKSDGVIPSLDGKFIQMGDYEDSYANLGMAKGIPLFEAEHFVISADISWSSGSITPNTNASGCGFFFGKADTNSHLSVTLRMDGRIYFTGKNNYERLSYGNYFYINPTVKGSGSLMLIVDGKNAAVYLNGNRITQKNDLPLWGNTAGLTVLSGSNKEFGTRCVFSNINVYQWELPVEIE